MRFIILNQMVNYYRTLDNTFSALSDPTRRAIISKLADGEIPIMQIATPFDMSLPAVSKHIRVLEKAGLVLRSGDDSWSVRSKLVREVAGASLDPADRRRMQEQLLLLLASEVQTHVARTDIARSVRAP